MQHTSRNNNCLKNKRTLNARNRNRQRVITRKKELRKDYYNIVFIQTNHILLYYF